VNGPSFKISGKKKKKKKMKTTEPATTQLS